MPSEVWGYRAGDHVEVRSGRTWRPGVVAKFDRDRNVWVRVAGRHQRLVDPRQIRPLRVPVDPNELDKWLED